MASDKLIMFFKGIKNNASHTKKVKYPAGIATYIKVAGQAVKLIKNNDEKTLTNDQVALAFLRRFTFFTVAFFAVRRNSEVLTLKASSVINRKEFSIIQLSHTKNDQLAIKKHQSIVPSIGWLNLADPHRLLQIWINIICAWHKNVPSPAHDPYIFPILTGKNRGMHLSADSARKDIAVVIRTSDPDAANESIFSARKGGAQFYTAEGDRNVAHSLGGWSTTDQLDNTYAPIKLEELARNAIALATKGVRKAAAIHVLDCFEQFATTDSATNKKREDNSNNISDIFCKLLCAFGPLLEPKFVLNRAPNFTSKIHNICNNDKRISQFKQWWSISAPAKH